MSPLSVLPAVLPAALVPDAGVGTTFTAPDVDWVAAGPVVAVLGAAVLGVLVEAFVPRGSVRRITQMLVAGLGLLVSMSFLVVLWGDDTTRQVLTSAADQQTSAMVLDKVALFLQATLVVLTALSLLVLGEKGTDRRLEAFAAQPATGPGSAEEAAAERAGRETTDVFPLAMFAVGGMMVFAAAADLLTMFVALEVLSLPLYIMCGLARRRRLLSQEASLKYFLLGAFSSALFLFGLALVYGVTGTVNLGAIGSALSQPGIEWTTKIPLLVVGAFLIVVGLLFKVGAVPFHAWTPDVYTGAPTSVTGFMAACTKVAAFGALIRVLYVSLPGLEEVLQPALWIISALTMVVGSLVAIRQTDVKRMLAYSSIAHAGFILTGLVTVQQAGVVGVLFYVLAYGLSTVACFGIVTLVRESDEDGGVGGEATHLSQWAGLGRRSPVLAASFTFLLLALAGIPLTSGFIAKVGVFSAAVTGGIAWLAVIGVLASAAAAFFYLRVVVLMYFTEPSTERPTVVATGWLTGTAIGIGVVATLVLGVFPQPFLDLAGAITAAAP